MKVNTKKEQNIFTKSVESIFKTHAKDEPKGRHRYVIETRWGNLGANISEENNHVYNVYMRFLEPEKVDSVMIEDICGGNINHHSFKWNLISNDMEFILGELSERLDNLKWLLNDDNYNMVLNY